MGMIRWRRRRVPVAEPLELVGILDLWTVRGAVAPVPGRLFDPAEHVLTGHRRGRNLICTAGYTAITQALVWSGIQDQATNIGVTSPTFLTPLYGAVGNGTPVTPVKSDTQLVAELGRATVGSGGSVPASASIAASTVWQFFFPQPASAWTVTEVGVFALASAAANQGALLNHLALSPTVSVPTSDTLILQVSFNLGP